MTVIDDEETLAEMLTKELRSRYADHGNAVVKPSSIEHLRVNNDEGSNWDWSGVLSLDDASKEGTTQNTRMWAIVREFRRKYRLPDAGRDGPAATNLLL
jgi:hypothetical protein